MLGRFIVARREQLLLRQEDLLGPVQVRHLSRIENGHTTNVGPTVLKNLAKVLDLSVEVLRAKKVAGVRPRLLLHPSIFRMSSNTKSSDSHWRCHFEGCVAFELSPRHLQKSREPPL